MLEQSVHFFQNKSHTIKELTMKRTINQHPLNDTEIANLFTLRVKEMTHYF